MQTVLLHKMNSFNHQQSKNTQSMIRTIFATKFLISIFKLFTPRIQFAWKSSNTQNNCQTRLFSEKTHNKAIVVQYIELRINLTEMHSSFTREFLSLRILTPVFNTNLLPVKTFNMLQLARAIKPFLMTTGRFLLSDGMSLSFLCENCKITILNGCSFLHFGWA